MSPRAHRRPLHAVVGRRRAPRTGIDVLMHLIVGHVTEDGFIHFVAFMLAFFALR
jgi:hypothetical protein